MWEEKIDRETRAEESQDQNPFVTCDPAQTDG